MNLGAWLWLLARELGRRPGRLVLLIFCLGVGTAVAGIATSVVDLLAHELEPRVRALFPDNRIIARAKPIDVSILRLEGPRITDATVTTTRALPGVGRVLPQLAASFPSSAIISFGSFGGDFQTDIILHGVPRELVEGDLPKGEPFTAPEPNSKRAVPVLVSAFFLDLYNLGLAESAGMPKLSPAAAKGREFTLILGESTIGASSPTAPVRHVRCRVVGLSPNPRLVGLAAPIDAVAAWNAEYAPRTSANYSALHIDLAQGADPAPVIAGLTELKLEATSDRDQREAFERISSAVQTLATGAALLIAALAGVGIGSTVAATIRERRGAWGVLRAAGISARSLVAFVVCQGAVVAVLGATFGALLFFGTSLGVAHFAGEFLAQSALLPANALPITPRVFAVVFGLALVLTELPMFMAALSMARSTPAELLAER